MYLTSRGIYFDHIRRSGTQETKFFYTKQSLLSNSKGKRKKWKESYQICTCNHSFMKHKLGITINIVT